MERLSTICLGSGTRLCISAMLQVPVVYGGQVSANSRGNSQNTTVYRDNLIFLLLLSLCGGQVSIKKNSQKTTLQKLFGPPFIIAPFYMI